MCDALFAFPLNRLNLLKLPEQKAERKIKIAVYRNHSFEMTAGILNVFLRFSGLEASFDYSDYDDSLNFRTIEADLHLIWVDIERYKTSDIAAFLKERAETLSAKTQKPVLLAYTGRSVDLSLTAADCFSFRVDDWLAELGDQAYDEAKEAYSGTRLSNKAVLEAARVLGLKYIPAIFKTPLKAVVLDLDNTLYKGILGEDGVDALIPDNALQSEIKKLKKDGFFICLCSKNEEEDVRKMFEKRTDFVLKMEDFTAVQINWQSKADNILKLAKTLNIGTDAMLFIDDNPAEIENVRPTGVKTLLAKENIARVVSYYPGLMKLRSSAEDALRTKDVQANAARMELAKTLSREEYFQKLGIKLVYSVNDETQIPRVAELFGKTNQFILSYKRYKETDVRSFMRDSGKCVITIHMSDSLSDSGIIVILAAHAENGVLTADELTVSCRALGRNLEDVMLPELFRLAQNRLHAKKQMEIPYLKGERNMPALKWLAALTGTETGERGTAVYEIPEKIDLSGLTVEVRE
ncbi:MAG: HAD-IIIC family phosphatase [Alphaproteobacteria bacterium]|nr:HAD-IIIC family phosphatase [Alphaproteobacteria bacterium]